MTWEPDQNKSVRLVFVGSLLKTKGVDLVTEAIHALCNEGVDVCLDIYGTGNAELIDQDASSCVS